MRTATSMKASNANLVERVMAFEHEQLVERIKKKLGISEEDAHLLFEDMKRFMFIAGTSKHPIAPSAPIDEAWHNFILFTKDYDGFCREHFGTFIHHVPTNPKDPSSRDRASLKRAIDLARSTFGNELSKNWLGQADCEDSPPECEQCSPTTNCQT